MTYYKNILITAEVGLRDFHLGFYLHSDFSAASAISAVKVFKESNQDEDHQKDREITKEGCCHGPN